MGAMTTHNRLSLHLYIPIYVTPLPLAVFTLAPARRVSCHYAAGYTPSKLRDAWPCMRLVADRSVGSATDIPANEQNAANGGRGR